MKEFSDGLLIFSNGRKILVFTPNECNNESFFSFFHLIGKLKQL